MHRSVRRLATLGLFGVLLAGCGTGGGTQPPVDASITASTTPAPTSSSAAGPEASPTPTSPAVLRRGAEGPTVTALQQRLGELGYWLGPRDGRFGDLTQQAVYALQKAAGLSRDGVVGPKTRAALARGDRPSARSTAGHVIEIDLDRQLLLVVDDGKVGVVLSTSTGTFENYVSQGVTHLADTPRGHWRVYREVDAWDPSPLGRLYRPRYFNSQGIAVHGYPSVPPYPASHGCARVSLAAMDWIWEQDVMPIGARVWVY